MFWGSTPKSQFSLFGVQHIFVIVILIGLILFIYKRREWIKNYKYENRIRYAIAGVLVLQTILYQAWLISNGTWRVSTSLPFSICECAAFLSIFMLIKKSKAIFEITYYWGSIISFLAVLTPSLSFTFPHFRFIEYFIEHGFIVIASVYMLIVHGYRPTQKSIWKTVILMNLCAPFVILLNHLTDGNYWFIAKIPSGTTLMSYFGGYPTYIFVAEIVGIVFFYICTLPFLCGKYKTIEE